MLSYPSIPTLGQNGFSRGTQAHAFIKYDGSNLRAEWSNKKGFHRFGTRTELMDSSHAVFGEAIEMWCDDIGPKLIVDLKNFDSTLLKKAQACTVFAEFFGKKSFAGTHYDESHQLKIIDVSIYKQGFMDPKDFVTLSSKQSYYATYLGVQTFNDELIQAVYSGQFTEALLLEQDLDEGIILKTRGRQGPALRKLKTKAWLQAIQGIDPAEVSRCTPTTDFSGSRFLNDITLE